MKNGVKPWEFMPAKRLGGFVQDGDGNLLRTCDVNSSVDVLAWNMGDSETKVQPSNRFRDFIYRRVNYGDGKKAVFRWMDNSDVFLTFKFKELYYLPFHKCFIGLNENFMYLFDEDPDKGDEWYLYAEPCKKCFVFGKFIMYSEDGTYFGLYDSELHRKVPPFFQLSEEDSPWETELFHSWTDDFFPVMVNGHWSFMDCHGNCFCREDSRIERFENAFLVSGKRLYGFNQKNGIPMELKLSCHVLKFQRLGRKKLVACDREHNIWYFDAFGELTDREDVYRSYDDTFRVSFSYYGQIVEEYTPLNSYFKTPLALPYKLGKRLYTCFFEISNDGKVGIINEETNKIVVEPIFDEVKYSGEGFRLTYGYKYIYLDELGNFLMEREE